MEKGECTQQIPAPTDHVQLGSGSTR